MYVIPGRVEEATFISRPNRFIVIVKWKGKNLRCHIANPGRMEKLLIPMAKVLIRMSKSTTRKTKASVVGVYYQKELIQLESNLVQKWLPYAFSHQEVPGLNKWKVIKQEVTMGRHRFDYILENELQEQVITEVKSTTRVTNGVACFPDGVSTRAYKHVQALLEYARRGEKTLILFVLQREAKEFWPCETVDPAFTAIFKEALSEPNMIVHVVRAMATINKKTHEMYMQFVGTIKIQEHHNL